MPSPCPGQFYRRKGGAWKKTSKGGYKKVGYGAGTHSKRDVESDRKRKAKVRKHLVGKYPQEYDSNRRLGL